MKRLETDVAIVGGGTAGMAAAVSAAENGARVMVFEKTGDLSWGGVGTFAVESRHQRSRRIVFSKKDAVQMFLRHAHYKSNARLIGEYVERAAANLEWLEEHGRHLRRAHRVLPWSPVHLAPDVAGGPAHHRGHGEEGRGAGGRAAHADPGQRAGQEERQGLRPGGRGCPRRRRARGRRGGHHRHRGFQRERRLDREVHRPCAGQRRHSRAERPAQAAWRRPAHGLGSGSGQHRHVHRHVPRPAHALRRSGRSAARTRRLPAAAPHGEPGWRTVR